MLAERVAELANWIQNTEPRSDGQLHKPTYECSICMDTGFIHYKKDGSCYSKHCTCFERKENLRRIQISGLSAQLEKCSFDNFKTAEEWQQKIKENAMSFVTQTGQWFFIGGQVGSGKTHLCTAIAGELLKKQLLKYMLWRDEAVKLKACVNNDEEYYRLITPLKDSSILYIDDFLKVGKNSSPTAADINIAFEIINHRYNNPHLTTIISSEFMMSQIIEFDEAVGSRILQRSGTFCMNIDKNRDKDYRLKQSRQ